MHGNIMPLVVTLVGTHTIATATDFIKRRRTGVMLLSHAEVKIAGSLVYPLWQMKSCSLTCLKVVSLGCLCAGVSSSVLWCPFAQRFNIVPI